MITLTIRYIALVAREGDVARIAFPREFHDLHVFVNGEDKGSAQRIELQVLNADQSPAVTTRVRGLPMGEPVLSVRRLSAGGPYALKGTDDLLRDELAQTVLAVPTGRFRSRLPHTTSDYATDRWDIGGGVRQTLTDQCECEVEFDSALVYRLKMDDSDSIVLADRTEILFSNEDVRPKPFQNNGHDRVEVSDAASFYRLVTPEPVNKPIPSTPYRQNAAGKAKLKGASFDMMGGGDLPLCPVGEP